MIRPTPYTTDTSQIDIIESNLEDPLIKLCKALGGTLCEEVKSDLPFKTPEQRPGGPSEVIEGGRKYSGSEGSVAFGKSTQGTQTGGKVASSGQKASAQPKGEDRSAGPTPSGATTSTGAGTTSSGAGTTASAGAGAAGAGSTSTSTGGYGPSAAQEKAEAEKAKGAIEIEKRKERTAEIAAEEEPEEEEKKKKE